MGHVITGMCKVQKDLLCTLDLASECHVKLVFVMSDDTMVPRRMGRMGRFRASRLTPVERGLVVSQKACRTP